MRQRRTEREGGEAERQDRLRQIGKKRRTESRREVEGGGTAGKTDR